MGREWYRSMITKGAGHHHHHHQRQSTLGCMSGMLQLFDFHHVLFTAPTSSTTGAVQNGSSSSPHSHLKGLEAPRNSLELDETVAAAAAAVSTSSIGEEFYGIPVGITIKKNRKDLQLWVEEEAEEKRNNSQAGTPRTPNVVARLMGLDILPDGASTPSIMGGFRSLDHSPKSSSRRKMMKKNVVIKDKQCIDESPPPRRPLQKKDSNVIGSRSLPDTPRASLERSRDVDPRLSFQINSNNKENYCNNNRAKELAYLCEVGRKSNNQEENNRSPRSQSYAREIVKQVKESINRRGFNNSNFVASNAAEISSKGTRPTDKNVDHEIKSFTATKPQKIHQAESRRENPEVKGFKHCKKSNYELRFNERVKKPPPQAETATRSDAIIGHSKLQLPPSSTPNLLALPQKPLSSYDTVKSITTVTATATATKKEASCGPPLRRRDQLLNGSGPSDGHRIHHQTNQNYTTEKDPEFQYVRSILDHAGITGTTRVRWYSPSLPVDPFVFHRLELDRSHHRNYDSTLRCNRKLLFHLVEEILTDIFTGPHTENISATRHQKKRMLIDINKDLLLERLWSKIKSFPLADCQVVTDIVALVAGDLESARVRWLLRHPSVVAEAESIALEIEQEVVDSVIGETAAFLAL